MQDNQARAEQPGAEQSNKQPAQKPASKKRKLLSRKAAAAALAAPQQATTEQSDGAVEHSSLAGSSRSGRKTVHVPAEDKESDAEHSEPVRSRKPGHKRAQQVPTPQSGEPEVGPWVGCAGSF